MSALAFVLILLAGPGLAAQLGMGLVSRVDMRRHRDMFAALAVWLPLSVPMTVASMALFDAVGGQSADMRSALSSNTPLAAMAPLASVTAIAWALGFGLGVFFGKARVYILRFEGFGGSPLERINAGIFPPVLMATVLTNTRIGDRLLIYSGRADTIQLGPEGRVDFIILADAIEKSFLEAGWSVLDNNARPDMPITRKPFVRLSEEADSARESRLPGRLIIESDDIANVYIKVLRGAGRADWIDITVDAGWNLPRKLWRLARRRSR